jgi:hypothetical protein
MPFYQQGFAGSLKTMQSVLWTSMCVVSVVNGTDLGSRVRPTEKIDGIRRDFRRQTHLQCNPTKIDFRGDSTLQPTRIRVECVLTEFRLKSMPSPRQQYTSTPTEADTCRKYVVPKLQTVG